MKILVTGASGQLGYDVCNELAKRNIDHLGTGPEDFDVTNPSSVRRALQSYAPDAVIHCAAWTAVDLAEDHAEQAEAINVGGTRNIAEVCMELDSKMIYISTDYVFPGEGDMPYEVDDKTGPINVYGRTKLQGEEAVRSCLQRSFIVRTSWVFGRNGNNFVNTMLRLSESNEEIGVVCDQFGSPTYTADLAPLLCDMAVSDRYGTYHATNEGFCSWADFAETIFQLERKQTKVHRLSTAEYQTKAARPFNSRMSKKSLIVYGFNHLPAWQDGLDRYLKEIRN